MSKWMINISWEDVPHLDDATKADLLAGVPLHQRQARAKGIPMLGAGAVYQVPEERFVIDPLPRIPPHWPRAFGFDIGWKCTAAIYGALDRDADILYLYSEHYAGQMPPQLHWDAMKRRGDWIPGAIDPSSAGRGIMDGKKAIEAYRGLGLPLMPADNAVEAGILEVQMRLESGRIKVFNTLRNWIAEYRIYRREDKPPFKPIKENDHLMDATRYLVLTGLHLAIVQPMEEDWRYDEHRRTANSVTGY